MTREQAKDILAAYRSGLDNDEPLMREAMAMAGRDAELRAWFEEQQRFDAAFRRKLDSLPSTGNLEAAIHHGVSMRRTRVWRQRLALAACLVALGMAAWFWLNPALTNRDVLARFRSHMAEQLATFPQLDLETEQHAAMRQWLAERHSIAQVELPAGLEKFPGIGCRTMQWQGRDVALLCFMVDGEVLHLFVLRADAFPPGKLSESPLLASSGRFSTAAWRHGDVAFVALTPGDEAFLRAHL